MHAYIWKDINLTENILVKTLYSIQIHKNYRLNPKGSKKVLQQFTDNYSPIPLMKGGEK